MMCLRQTPALPDQKMLFEGGAVPAAAACCPSAWSSALAHEQPAREQDGF